MKNEAFARAITNIDSDLIEEALENTPVVHHKRKYIAIISAAACFVLIFSLTLILQQKGGITIYSDGNTLNGNSIVIDSPADAPNISRGTQNIISVPLEISGKGKITICALDGTVAINSTQTNKLLYTNQSCTVSCPVTLWWNIGQPDKSQVYSLSLMNDVTLLLSFNDSTEQWLLKQK